MVTSELRMTTGGFRKTMVYGLLVSVAAMVAMLFFQAGSAFADEPVNTDSAATGSTSSGTAGTGTGDATATGNTAGTDTTTVSGPGGSIQIVQQRSKVTNRGTARAVSGNNTSTGNDSNNVVVNDQNTPGGNGINTNQGSTTNSSTGSSSVTTGNSSATGNASNTSINQVANGAATGTLGGILIVTQDANVVNRGDATAVSGNNRAVGNDSNNRAFNDQDPPLGDINTNAAVTSNSSGGNALIDTGDATAVGNSASTSISQVVNGVAGGSLGGIAIIDSNANVTNRGTARAVSGNNVALGNDSRNRAINGQHIGGRGPPNAINNNSGTATNWSDGDARIFTGNSEATGNSSSTHIHQSANVAIAGSGFVISNQRANIVNRGDATAISGGNRAVGNDSNNRALNCQLIDSGEECVDGELFGDDLSAAQRRLDVDANFGAATNKSNGFAGIATGNASATGNRSDDSITQTTNAAFGGFGFVIATPVANVTNRGDARAVSGNNTAVGNDSRNFALNCQKIDTNDACIEFVEPEPQGAAIVAAQRRIDVDANFGQALNKSDGHATIITGDALSTGNSSKTAIHQGVNAAIGGFGFVIATPRADVTNRGTGTAISGGNRAVGNDSNNRVINCQLIDSRNGCVGERGRGLSDAQRRIDVDSNFGTATNESNGTASIHTGTAHTTGNEAHTRISQPLNAAIGGFGFVIFEPRANVTNRGNARAVSGNNTAIGNDSRNLAVNCQLIDSSGPCVELGDGPGGGGGGGACPAQHTVILGNGQVRCRICHVPPRTDQTKLVPIPALGGHLGHGDFFGACPGDTSSAAEGGTGAAGIGAAQRRLDVDANFGAASNVSNGHASIVTGCACAVGNLATTGISQTLNTNIGGAAGLLGLGAAGDPVFFLPVANVTNRGDGRAVSGNNRAVGNDSRNLALNCQLIDSRDCFEEEEVSDVAASATTFNPGIPGASPLDGVLPAGISGIDAAQLRNAAINTNNGTVQNHADGSASIKTGNTDAVGNWTATGITQGGSINQVGFGFTIFDPVANLTNRGDATAISGGNNASGNDSRNLALNFQDVGGRGGLAVNNALTSNHSGGSSSVHTGDAQAIGNLSASAICQGINGPLDCPVPPLPPKPDCPCPKAKPKDVDVKKPVVEEKPKAAPKPVTPGEALARTGAPFGIQLLLALVLIALGALLRRKGQVTA